MSRYDLSREDMDRIDATLTSEQRAFTMVIGRHAHWKGVGRGKISGFILGALFAFAAVWWMAP